VCDFKTHAVNGKLANWCNIFFQKLLRFENFSAIAHLTRNKKRNVIIRPLWSRNGGKALLHCRPIVAQNHPNCPQIFNSQVLVVLTDGQSSDDSETPAKGLKRAGVEIYAIGVGNHVRKPELIAMATDGSHVFTSDFDSLKALEKPMRDRVCEPPSIVYKCQCECCGDIYTCTQNDVKHGFPCKRSCKC